MKKVFLLLVPFFMAGCGSDSDVKSDIKDFATFPQYGNYCGLDRPAVGEKPTPIDATDAACKNHDACYQQKGSFNTVCDTTLIPELKNISPQTEPEKIARKSIISYFRHSPQKELMEINFDNIKL